jgi:hypothetical protein
MKLADLPALKLSFYKSFIPAIAPLNEPADVGSLNPGFRGATA